jgi:hypothetical protein
MVVHVSKAQILKRQMTQLLNSLADFNFAVFDFF